MCWDVPPQYPLMLYAHREIVQCIFSSEQILPLTCFFPDVLLVLGRHAQFLGAKLDPMVQDQLCVPRFHCMKIHGKMETRNICTTAKK